MLVSSDCLRECTNTNTDNRRMWLEVAHIDKDAQDLSRRIVDTRPTRLLRREQLFLIHTFKIITNAPTRPRPSERRERRRRSRLYANPILVYSSVPQHRQFRSVVSVV